MDRSEILKMRKQARAEKALVDEELMSLHILAIDVLRDPDQSAAVRQRALEQIQKWQDNALCLPRYVAEWRRLLALPIDDMAVIVLCPDAAGVDLRQNSPFGFLRGEH